ncbi:hemicentin-2-like [Siniperca chuatsi]|uniref:hemicentin-2-like n=1 Tax=Siniperca chuatsi TaxID=119488 RepID=UPI001CE19B4D|nr:hemicentin-2-like [Siniperca chuatsi]
MVHPSACLLLLLLTCLAGFSAGETEQGETMGESSYGPASVVINGADIVTVGIPYGFQCSANCYPGCQYSWTRDNVTTQGPELSLQLLHKVPTQTLTCTVLNPATGKSVTIQKTLQVMAGPSNIQISGPPSLTIGVASNFTCSADCYPSCSYSWTVVVEEEAFSTAQGNTISVTPPASTVASETLVCIAEDTVSHLYISTTLLVWVASLSDISIAGDSTVTMGKQYTFTCLVACIPSCTITWKYMGKTFQGDQIDISVLNQENKSNFGSHLKITFSDYSKIEPLTCEATNTASHATITTTKNLSVIDPISVHSTSQALPVAGKSFSLQCAGTQNPASITWLKNKRPMPANERVNFSPDDITMTFSPLLQEDGGLYQCVAAERGTSIQSVGYNMQVNYGPSSVVINGVDIVTVGKLYGFQCSASCYPTCQFTWTRGNVTSQGPELSLQLGELQPPQNLTCTAVNPATGISVTAQKTLQMTDGPKNVIIAGPESLEIGVTASFTCSAECTPSCSFTWTLYGKTITGSAIDITVNRYVFKESISCQAENTFTGKTAMVNETLSVSDPHWCGC